MELMHLTEAMTHRHAARAFSDRPIDAAVLEELEHAIDQANAHSGLHIQLVHDDTDAFGGCPTHYGRFSNVRYCIALIGADSTARANNDGHAFADLDERVGYFGEMLALRAVQAGLDTGWVVLHETTEHDGRWQLNDGERMPAALAIGYSARPGRPHRSKPLAELGTVESAANTADPLAEAPSWFVDGLQAVALAPSALGKQPVRFTLLDDGHVRAEALNGVQSQICLGVAKYHFEIGSGRDGTVFA